MERAAGRPKLIFLDLDGTLLNEEKQLSAATATALTRASAAGAQLVIATGRFYDSIPITLLALPFLRYFVLMNGAKVYDRQTGETLYRAEIELATAQRVFAMGRELDVSVDCFQNDRGLMGRSYYERLDYYIPDEHSRRLVRTYREVVEDFPRTVEENATGVQKIQFFFPDLALRPAVIAQLEEAFPQLVSSVSMPGNLEINQGEATKGNGLLALCSALGIHPADTAAFGDSSNDLSIFRVAGVAVAMANASPEALALAHLVAPSHAVDGVAQILHQWYDA